MNRMRTSFQPMPGTRRFKIVRPQPEYPSATGSLLRRPPMLISSQSYGFLSREEARRWAEDNDVGPFSIIEYVAGSAEDPRVARPAMRASRSPVDDPFYVIQPLYSDGTIVGGHGGSYGYDDEGAAVREAKRLLRDPMFEGDYVRVITRDGELVWDSRGGIMREARTRRGRR